jgi:hypothetical protein
MQPDDSGYIFAMDIEGVLRKIAPSGKILWRNSIKGASSVRLATSPDGACYLAGVFSDSINIGGVRLTPQKGPSAFVTRIDPVPFSISKSADRFVVSWPLLPIATLEAYADLGSSTWAPVTRNSSVIEDQNVLIDTAGDPKRFYRLRPQD